MCKNRNTILWAHCCRARSDIRICPLHVQRGLSLFSTEQASTSVVSSLAIQVPVQSSPAQLFRIPFASLPFNTNQFSLLAAVQPRASSRTASTSTIHNFDTEIRKPDLLESSHSFTTNITNLIAPNGNLSLARVLGGAWRVGKARQRETLVR